MRPAKVIIALCCVLALACSNDPVVVPITAPVASFSAQPSPSAPSPQTAIGKTLEVENSSWTLLEIRNLGNRIEPRVEGLNERRTTSGRFLLFRFRILNSSDKTQTFIDPPVLVDRMKRELRPLESERDYLKDDSMVVENMVDIQRQQSRDFVAIYEIPADARDLAWSITPLGKLKKSGKSLPLGF